MEYRGKEILEDRGAMSRKECDIVRCYKAKDDDKFLSGWLRGDTEGEAEELEEIRKNKNMRNIGWND